MISKETCLILLNKAFKRKGGGVTPTGEIDITANGTYDVTNYAEANVNVGGSSGFPPDWTEIGYENTPTGVIDGYNYAKEIYDNWDSSITSMQNKYSLDKKLSIFPLVDTSNITNMQSAFNGCSSLNSFPLVNTNELTSLDSAFRDCSGLISFPELNTNKVMNFNFCFVNCINLKNFPVLSLEAVTASGIDRMFSGCTSLSDESLNNILQMFINATSRISARNRTLYYAGFRSSNYPTSRIESLSNYQSFLDAGWTTGF